MAVRAEKHRYCNFLIISTIINFIKILYKECVNILNVIIQSDSKAHRMPFLKIFALIEYVKGFPQRSKPNALI